MKNQMESSPFAIFLFFLIIPISSSLAQTQTNGSIAVGSSLTANQNSPPWISPSGDFAFGFRFIRQQSLYLLCIWFNNIPEQTIAWYPRGGVLVPSGSRLDLNARSGLVLTDPQGNQLWSSALKSYSRSVDHGFINNTGNFVLIGSGNNSTSLWESFENPADTLLPTQTVEMNGVVESRLSDTNFSRGRFQFRLLADGNAVLNPRNDVTDVAYDAYFWSNTFDGSNSSNSGRQLIFRENGHIIIFLRNGRTVDLTADMGTQSGEFYYRATLNFDGVFVIYRHPRNPNSQQNWTILWTRPNNICLNLVGSTGSGACGFNSICNIDSNRRPYCECPPGYSLLDPNNRYGSCKQNFLTSCDEKGQELGDDLYRFEELTNIDWPLNDYEHMEPFSQDNCRTACLNDCFCAVAIHRSNSCWKKRLPLSNGKVDTGLNSIAFLKVKADDNVQKKCPNNQKTLILVVWTLLGSSVFVNIVLLCAGFLFFFRIYKRKANKPITRNNKLESNLQVYSFEELVRATNEFSEELGRGAFGTVYKGVLNINGNRSYVAIKNLDRVAEDAEKEFRAELSVIARTHHKNLVQLLGFCDHADKRLLVYEYMSNGTLASFLFGSTKPRWKQRIEIALAAARGVLYLHEECATQIIHCDIKPQNILLDDNYNAHISDFGLSKLLMVDQSHTQTGLRGTKGYVAPEWFRNTKITTKVDVYSFGVLLLEIITCRKSVISGEVEVLVDWVWDCFQAGKIEKLVENDVEALNDIKILKRFLLVGIWCIQEDPLLRPNIKKVNQMLEGVVQVSIPPCPFPFSVITTSY